MDRISLSNGSVDRTNSSNPVEDLRTSSQVRKSQSAKADDAISLSAGARDAERLSNMLDLSRASRLEQVRDALANGTYHVSGADIAEKLIEFSTR